MKISEKIGAIVLAAGKGKRMQSKEKNKVVLPLGNKPMIIRTVDLLQSLELDPIVIVIGFAKQSVIDVLGNTVIYAEQKEQLGTANAVECGLRKITEEIHDVIVLNGDDSALYSAQVIKDLIVLHRKTNAAVTLLTLQSQRPFGIGRIMRDKHGTIEKIVEEKDATEKEKNIKEINPGCYLFEMNFLKQYLRKVKKSTITGEYYLTALIDLAIAHGESVQTMNRDDIRWRGINTPEELQEAEQIFNT